MGAHDQNCCTFGAGAVDDGTAVLVMGTFGSCFVVSDKSIRDPKERLVVKGNSPLKHFTIPLLPHTAGIEIRSATMKNSWQKNREKTHMI